MVAAAAAASVVEARLKDIAMVFFSRETGDACRCLVVSDVLRGI